MKRIVRLITFGQIFRLAWLCKKPHDWRAFFRMIHMCWWMSEHTTLRVMIGCVVTDDEIPDWALAAGK